MSEVCNKKTSTTNMRALSFFILPILALVHNSAGYAISPIGTTTGYTSRYTTTSTSSVPSYTSGPGTYFNCCQLGQWAHEHMNEISQLANRVRQQYNRIGSNMHYPTSLIPWNTNIIQLSGKTPSELDNLVNDLSDTLTLDMRRGYLTYPTLAQPGFFEWKAAEALKLHNNDFDSIQQQQQQELEDIDFPSNFPSHTSFTNTGMTTHSHYNPNFNLGYNKWNGGLTSYRPPTRIPINTNVETINSGTYGHVFPGPTYISPGSTVTVKRFNKTIITNPDGTQHVSGSESNKKWVDGQLVYDHERPFGDWTVPRDEAWKREEREQFFWFLTQGATTIQNLEAWQRQHEERLQALAQRYHTTVDAVYEWHRKELNRFIEMQRQYQAISKMNLKSWQRMECERLDWLVHQNSWTRDELQRWQRENQMRLAQLAQQYQISLDELKSWQIDELNRVYVYFNDQTNALVQHPITDSLHRVEEERLNELIRQHNRSIAQIQESIKLDQQKLIELSKTYKGNVQDMEAWLKAELARLRGVITDQQLEVTRITEWQRSERERLENIVKQHHGSVAELDQQMQHDRAYIQALASKYKVSIEELESWQRNELKRLHNQGQAQLELNIKEWQRREREHLMSIIKKNDLTIEEFQQMIVHDRARLEDLAKTYKIQVSEVEEWIKNEIKNFQSQGLLKEVEMHLAQWQQQERDRLLMIVKQNELTVEELELKIKNEQTHLNMLASTYQVQVSEIEEWLKKELLRLQSEGLIKVEELKDWQKNERIEILKIVQQNKLTFEEFEKMLLKDRQRLEDLSRTYNVQISEIETWIKKEGERLQNIGLLQMQEQLNYWQKIERERLLTLVKQNNLTIEELEQRIKNDQVHLQTLAQQHHVRVEEIEEWIRQEIKKLQREGVIEMEKLMDWQVQWRGNLTNLVRERDFTVEEFHKWLLEDRARLQALAMQHNIEIEEIEQWIRDEEQHFVSMGLLKPNEKLTNWQQIERNYLERIIQERYHSTEQLEQRLRQDREIFEKLARDYSVQVEEIERWMKKELARLRDEGRLQIENLTAWQIAERERLEQLIKQQKQYTVEEFEALLRQDREHMQKMAFQYHTSVEEIEKWVRMEVERLRQQGKLNIENLTAWQKVQQQHILDLLQQQSSITLEEFERKVEMDRSFILQLAQQYRIKVEEVEAYVKKIIEELRAKGKFEIENLQAWQIVERDYIKQLIAQYKNNLSTKELEQKLLSDRLHLQQLADQYRINQKQIEQWMIEELQRLRKGSENSMQQLSDWQLAEVQRIKELIRQNSHLTYVEFEVQLMTEHARLQELAKQHTLNVDQIESWLRQQLINLKTTGNVQVESLTIWQQAEQKRLIDMLLQQQQQISLEQFEQQLRNDRARLQQLALQYSITAEQIERYMRDELQRLQNSGLLQVQELNTWQKIEQQNLRNWLEKNKNAVTSEQFDEFLNRDRLRLQQIAQDYHVTVEEVRNWVRQEGARLRILGIIHPQNVIYVDNQNITDDMWKVHTRAHLEAIAQVRRYMTWQDFERYLTEEQMRWEQFARQYNITVVEIKMWLRDVAQELVQQGLIQRTGDVKEWQLSEQLYIENLINERLRKQQQWSIEELERMLKNDQQHLQQLAVKYRLTIDEIEKWYQQELQRLLNLHKITSEHLLDWQRQEKERIYWVVKRQPKTSMTTLTEQLLRDKNNVNRLAGQYHVTIREYEDFVRQEVKRLLDLGLVTESLIRMYDWKQQENERLRTIAAEISITKDELLELIEKDKTFNQQLIELYGCVLSELAPTQNFIIRSMEMENLLDNTKLLHLEEWQKSERERLYNFIKKPNFNLKERQREDAQFLQETADMYGISVETLKSWQLQEYERLQKLAEQYQLTLPQLYDFRNKELLFIKYVMHKKTSNEAERIRWGVSEAKRMEELEKKTGLSGANLLQWRRKLYLLCEGLIPMDDGRVSTNRRGDQPQKTFDESIGYKEPGLQVTDPLYPAPTAQMRLPNATPKTHPSYLPPLMPSYGMEKRDSDQQQVEDFGQQQQVDLAWMNEDFDNMGQQQQQQQQQEDFGQQQQIELADFNQEDFGQQHEEVDHYGDSFQNTASQKQMLADSQQQKPVEVKAEAEPTGVFSRLKNKLFG